MAEYTPEQHYGPSESTRCTGAFGQLYPAPPTPFYHEISPNHRFEAVGALSAA